MATIATRVGHGGSGELSANMAMRLAWWTWLTMLLAPFILFLFVAYRLMDGMATTRDQSMSNAWFIGTMAYLAVATTSALFWRSRLFRSYWQGEVVQPKAYLTGMVAVWLALETGGVLSLIGCLLSNSMMPCMIPALAAFMFFLPFWPSGHAMVRRNVGNSDDTGRYEEPR